ncbi:delta subunit of the central stalk of mitochondrial F1F0 ATP synthase, atp16 [Coemansia sp. RSA 455]|nr:delta subunit of the central stalk of mitochondrial F1F0 ATP synthase, atp16 [Coemansia sp. S17]KAJ2013637.1 delta subunit of the central stalk of mitochondrial F1F0 ATP synthase, atp16 [Coemansia sp. S680]KAJ2044045.1 delta subunit of the central stalk of mitochondrial F1F0 ATP synthase, atp16 [Coemansia sp. S2]KAJ2096252.1 delta subunit of the central stalk of mitochondrial F1F0 ATP synthase, atp16 [Coemansia sp. S142-1]KAJ2255848.1 delta subunit of the central stalk of mitochondrial F1F0 
MSFLARTLKPATALARVSRLSARFYASEAAAAPTAGKLVVNFALPHAAVLKGVEVNQVDMSAVSGDLGILADHVPTIEQLKPGVIDIIADSGSTKYFVSGGFAIMNPNSVLNINAIEAFKLEDIDPQAVAANLAESQRLASSAKDEATKEAAAVEIELYEAIQTAFSAKSK